jgi:hypothetical protein
MLNLSSINLRYAESIVEGVVTLLSEKYKFDKSEAMLDLKVNFVKKGSSKGRKKEGVSKSKVGKISLVLPFCDSKIEGRCSGIRVNSQLYSQCLMEPQLDGDFCKTCQGQANKSDTGKPTYGTVSDRLACEDKSRYMGKVVAHYGNVMEKQKITREAVDAAAATLGIVIPETYFEVKETKRGRPKKDASVSDTESEKTLDEPKKRGRPKGSKKVKVETTGDDMIAHLVAEAKKQEGPAPPEPNVELVVEEPVEEAEKPVVVEAEKPVVVEAEKPVVVVVEAEKPEVVVVEAEKPVAVVVEDEKPVAVVVEDEKPVAVVVEAEGVEESKEMEPVQEPSEMEELVMDEEEDEDEEGEEVSVEKWSHPSTGLIYLKDEDGRLYDKDTQDHIGNWDGETIQPVEDDDE